MINRYSLDGTATKQIKGVYSRFGKLSNSILSCHCYLLGDCGEIGLVRTSLPAPSDIGNLAVLLSDCLWSNILEALTMMSVFARCRNWYYCWCTTFAECHPADTF